MIFGLFGKKKKPQNKVGEQGSGVVKPKRNSGIYDANTGKNAVTDKPKPTEARYVEEYGQKKKEEGIDANSIDFKNCCSGVWIGGKPGSGIGKKAGNSKNADLESAASAGNKANSVSGKPVTPLPKSQKSNSDIYINNHKLFYFLIKDEIEKAIKAGEQVIYGLFYWDNGDFLVKEYSSPGELKKAFDEFQKTPNRRKEGMNIYFVQPDGMKRWGIRYKNKENKEEILRGVTVRNLDDLISGGKDYKND